MVLHVSDNARERLSPEPLDTNSAHSLSCAMAKKVAIHPRRDIPQTTNVVRAEGVEPSQAF